MISDADIVVLDTNALIYIGRGSDVCAWFESTWKLLSRKRRCVVSRVSHAEMAAFMARNGWSAKKEAVIAKLLAGVITVEITAPGLQDAYVALDVASAKHPSGAKNMGKHDLWIAATTKAVNGILVTCDPDFDHLSPGFIKLAKYDPQAIRQSTHP